MIDTSLSVVTCSHCGSLHGIPGESLGERSVKEINTLEPTAKPKQHQATLPSRFRVKRASGSMEITWPVGGIFPGFVLLLIAAGFAYAAMTSGMLYLLIACVGVFYFAIVQAFNTHRIRADRARLHITQGPLPWLGKRKLDAADIVQLFTTEHKSKVENSEGGNSNVKIRKYYRLSANTRSRGRITVLGGLGDPNQALWLEQEIESLLGIKDKQVTGEHAP